jgi:outer membrane protein assembly factor BamB
MTRPPSGEWPAGPANPVPFDDRDPLDVHEIEAMTAELTRAARPAPARLREWVVATADAERASGHARPNQRGVDRRVASTLQPIGIHGPTFPTRGHEEDAMSGNSLTPTHLATLPVSSRPAGLPRLATSSRRGRLVRRWNRHGWPVVELLGAAALIVGLVSVMLGGGNGGLPALVPSFGQTTQVATPVADAGDVAMAQGNAGRTGEMPGPGVASAPQLLWRADIGYPSTAVSPQVVVAGGIAYSAVTNAGPASVTPGLRAEDVADGAVQWEIAIDARALSAPVVAQGLVFVAVTTAGQPLRIDGSAASPAADAAAGGFVVAFDALSGTERWRTGMDRLDRQELTVADGRLFVGDQSGTIYAIDARTGATAWTTFIPPSGNADEGNAPVLSPVTVAGGTAFVVSALGSLYAYDAADGDLKWTQPVSTGDALYPSQAGNWPVVTGSSVLIVSPDVSPARTSRLISFDAADGRQLWSQEVHLTMPAGLATDGTTVYLAGQDQGSGVLVALDAGSGETRWTSAMRRAMTVPPVIANGTVYVGGQDWQLFAFAAESGRLRWSVSALGAITSPAYVSGGTLLFTASDGFLTAIQGSPDAAELLTTQDPVDVSGLPPCQVPPRARDTTGTATPIVTPTPVPPLVPVDADRPFDWPAIRLADIPNAGPASPEAIAGIQATMAMFTACSRPDDGLKRDGLFSQVYFQRTGLTSGSMSLDDVGGRPLTVDASNTWTVPDGRTALVVMDPTGEGEGYGTLHLFTRTDDRWLIDEQVRITPSGHSGIG